MLFKVVESTLLRQLWEYAACNGKGLVLATAGSNLCTKCQCLVPKDGQATACQEED